MGERVDQFVGLTHDTNERCTFPQRLHGGDTYGLHSVSGKRDTGSKTIERGWWPSAVLVGPAGCVPFEGEEQVERFAAFQHPNRYALASLV